MDVGYWGSMGSRVVATTASTITPEYSALKQRLTLTHSNGTEAYVAGKDPFSRQVEAKALAWSRTA